MRKYTRRKKSNPKAEKDETNLRMNEVKGGKNADAVREACKDDLRYFYLNILDRLERGLGYVHDFYIDFLRLHELDTCISHSPIKEYLPKKVNGKFPETWIYFPTLRSKPIIQEGDEGPVSKMFREDPWQGLLIRVKGNGKRKCSLLPRGHLKTELGIVTHTLWEAIKDPTLRCAIRCATGELAKTRLSDIKQHFETNDKFMALFGNMKPPREGAGVWNQDAVIWNVDKRRGRDPSIATFGGEKSMTGGHYDRLKLDDIVDEGNTGTAEQIQKTRKIVQRMGAVGDPGHHMHDIGTIWADGDAHSLFIGDVRANPLSKHTSFIVGTLTDTEGELLWPEMLDNPEMEGMTKEEYIELLRDQCNDEYHFYNQYYNQVSKGGLQSFNKEWIQQHDIASEELVRTEKLDIIMVTDPANTVNKKSDYSACTVMGQSPNGTKRYLLGGFRERCPPDKLPDLIADEIIYWRNIAISAGTSFRVGIESYSFQKFLKRLIEDTLRARGESCFIEPLEPHKRNKIDRIRVLLSPFSCGRYYIPHTLRRIPRGGGDAYDLIADFLAEYTRFPRGLHDDLLDCFAYADEMMRPTEFKKGERANPHIRRHGEDHGRSDALKEGNTFRERMEGNGVDWGKIGNNNWIERSRMRRDAIHETFRATSRYKRRCR